MAEGKKSFLMYADVHYTVKHLSNEQAGELFKHLLSYVNDENPKTDNPIINIAFEPIKQSLKRDLKKYEKTKEDKSIAGIIGNLKRWYPDIYNDYQNKKISLKEAQKIANDRKESQCDNSLADIAVNDNDNDSDSVNDNDSDSVNEKNSSFLENQKKSFNDFDRDSYFSVDELAKVYLEDEKLLSLVSKNTGKTIEELKSSMPEFLEKLKSEGRSTDTPGEFAKYFRNIHKGNFDLKTKSKPVAENKSGEYSWTWKGNFYVKFGNKEQYLAAKRTWDQEGFGFRTLKSPEHA